MKTYSRKRVEDQKEVILDLNELCRLCMTKEDELIPIFNNSENEPIPLTLRIMACVALEVFEGDGLPDKICHPCKYQLEKSYNFRKKCENSDIKLRQHLKNLQMMRDSANENQGDSFEREDECSYRDKSEDESSQQEPSTEEDLVGVTQVAYIQPDHEPDEDPESITLPVEEELINKDACTLKTNELKNEIIDVDANNENGREANQMTRSGFVLEENNTELSQENVIETMDDENFDVIAEAVKATLASQPGLNVSGNLQLKVNQTAGKSTQVEVTTEDGSVIVMELSTEDDDAITMEANSILPKPIKSEPTSDSEMKVFLCPNCPKSFSRRIQLRRHASVHQQQRGYSCGICEKWFPTRSALVRHERIHTGERPFQCEVCQKSFAQKEILFRHLMTHSGRKPYNCPHCTKGFTQKEPLRVHMRSHISVNPSDIILHYCTLCPKVFCHASGLSRHLVTHTGKTFKCRDCDKSFTDKSSLRRHHRQTLHQP